MGGVAAGISLYATGAPEYELTRLRLQVLIHAVFVQAILDAAISERAFLL